MRYRPLAFALLLALVMLAAPALLAAQTIRPWEVKAIIGNAEALELVTLTAEGIVERQPLPASFPFSREALALSPDGRLLATVTPTRDRIVIADMASGECCTTFSFTDAAPFEVTLAGFSPDGAQLALGYFVEEPFASGMMALDVATGDQVAFVDTTPEGGSDAALLTYPYLFEWRDEGVIFLTTCTRCVEGGELQRLKVWNPQTGDIAQSGEWSDYRGDTLPLARAQLRPRFGLDYPAAPDADAIIWGPEAFGERNVVVASGSRFENGSAVVYFDADNLTIDRARWVADGAAFLVFADGRGGQNALVTPRGAQPVDFPAERFLLGVTDGWLTLEDGAFQHYRLTGDDIERLTLDEYDQTVIVLASTPLGANGAAAFPTVPPPARVTCEGFLESRLLPGHGGRVLPGPANNVRAEPSTTSQIVAKIAGGEEFAVLEGPACRNGMAWWRVRYHGWEGWTAEGSGRNYWLEPAAEQGYR